jgi:hypothetical protein
MKGNGVSVADDASSCKRVMVHMCFYLMVERAEFVAVLVLHSEKLWEMSECMNKEYDSKLPKLLLVVVVYPVEFAWRRICVMSSYLALADRKDA